MVVARTLTSPPPTAAESRCRISSAMRSDPRLLADQHAVGVDERPPGVTHLPVGLGEQHRARRRRGSARRPTGTASRCRRARRRRAARRSARARERRRRSGPRARADGRTSTPPSTSGTPSASACASTPMPDAECHREHLRQLRQRTDPDRTGRRLVEQAPRPAPDVHRHAGRRRAPAGHRCRRGRPRTRSCQAPRRPRSTTRAKNAAAGFSTPQRADEPTKSTCGRSCSSVSRGVLPTAPTTRPPRRAARRRRQRVRVEVAGSGRQPAAGGSTPSSRPHVVVRTPARGQPAEHAHQREARHAHGVGRLLPHPRLVDERLADVEDDGGYSHAATRSRSAGVVTLSSRSSPSTTVTRPPGRLDERGAVGSFPAGGDALRSTRRDERLRRLHRHELARARASRRRHRRSTRLTVSETGRPGTAPSNPSPSASSSRGTTSSGSSGRAASCTRITAASSGTSAIPARTEADRVSPPVHARASPSTRRPPRRAGSPAPPTLAARRRRSRRPTRTRRAAAAARRAAAAAEPHERLRTVALRAARRARRRRARPRRSSRRAAYAAAAVFLAGAFLASRLAGVFAATAGRLAGCGLRASVSTSPRATRGTRRPRSGSSRTSARRRGSSSP